MGGGISLSIAASETEDIAGLILFAPYPGPRTLLAEIAEAGGLSAWTPGFSDDAPEYRPDGGLTFRGVWSWLQNQRVDQEASLPIYLNYGRNDRGAGGFELLAEALDPAHVITANGGHGWSTWNPMWNQFINSGVLQNACGTVGVETGP